jgi:serine/threonine protein kinase
VTDYILDRLVAAVGTQYLVDAEIGRGGMAVVYRATDTRLHRRVAIKVLPPELAFNADVRERFLREAQTSAQLSHPGIVPIYTVDEADGLVYFVMALVDGESLAQRLARPDRLPMTQVRTILTNVADALAYAHARGVVHRDVKPDNIMIDGASGRAMVTDFGIARAAAGESRLTLTGVAIGTPAYMSPEQALGERELDGRSDIYSLGVIGYQMLAGETPFRASNTPAMLVKHVSEAPRPLHALRPDAPPELAHAIMRALAKKPEDRWPDAAAFRDALSGAAPSPPFEDRSRTMPRGDAFASAPRREPEPDAPRLPQGYPPSARPWAAPMEAPPTPPQYPIAPRQDDDLPRMPAMPTWGSRKEWREWRRAHKVWERERHRRDRARSGGPRDLESDARRPVEERIARVRRKAIGAAGTVGTTAVINMLTAPHFLWFLIPSAFATFGVVSAVANLWSDGVPLSRIFSRGDPGRLPGTTPPESLGDPRADPALALAPADVLAGTHGEAVRRAADDQRAAREILAKLAPSERELIPDVGPTVDALAQRVGSLALTLHRLDADVSGASVPALEQRLAALRAEAGDSPSAEQERRIALLDRQRGSIAELAARHGTLAAQLESASLALQNLRLDLLKLRSSGFGSAMSDDASATQEARALSRDIAHAVDAVREANRL